MKKTVLILFLLTATSGYANSMGSIPDFEGFWLSPGISGSISKDHTFLGGEASVIYLGENLFYGGLYTDISRSLNKHMRYISGPEFGFAIFGLDGGYVYQNESGKIYRGFAVRPYLFIPFYASLCLYYRRIEFKDTSWYGTNEIGFQVKVPIALSGQR